jgi:integrase
MAFAQCPIYTCRGPQKNSPGKDNSAFSGALRAVKPPKKTTNAIRRAPSYCPPEEEGMCLKKMSVRDAVLFQFLLGTGVRISEALGIWLENCKAEGPLIARPFRGKKGKASELRVIFSNNCALPIQARHGSMRVRGEGLVLGLCV